MRRRLPIPLAVVAVLVVGACGRDGATDAAPTTAEVTAAPAPTAAGEATGDESDEGMSALESLLPGLLIEPHELGDPSFVDAGFSPSDLPGPCPMTDDGSALPPPSALVGAALRSDRLGTTVRQEIRVYETEEDAGAAYVAATPPGCPGASDVTKQVGADEATLVAPADNGGLVVARVADSVLIFDVSGAAVDLVDLAAFGVAKVRAALEG